MKKDSEYTTMKLLKKNLRLIRLVEIEKDFNSYDEVIEYLYKKYGSSE